MIDWFNNNAQQEEIDFFGIKNNKKRKPTISFLGLNPQRVNFSLLKPSPLFKKESTAHGKLSKWGDADMDGTPNYFDCDPRDWMKDEKRIKKMTKNVRGRPRRVLSQKYIDKQNEINREYGFNELGVQPNDQILPPSNKPVTLKTGRNVIGGNVFILPGKKKRSKSSREEILKRVAQELAILRKAGKPGKGKETTYQQARAAIELAALAGKMPKRKYMKRAALAEAKQIIRIREPLYIETPPKPKEPKPEKKMEEMTEKEKADYKKELAAYEKEKVTYEESISPAGIRKLREEKMREIAAKRLETPKKVLRGVYGAGAYMFKEAREASREGRKLGVQIEGKIGEAEQRAIARVGVTGREVAGEAATFGRKVGEISARAGEEVAEATKKLVTKPEEVLTLEGVERGAGEFGKTAAGLGEAAGKFAVGTGLAVGRLAEEGAVAVTKPLVSIGYKMGEIAAVPFTTEGREKIKERMEKGVMVAQRVIGKVEVSPEAMIERSKAIGKAIPKAMRVSYGKAERIATGRVRRLVRGGLGAAFGSSITQTRFGPAIRGRPHGPSGKYMIEGKPVFEEEYQQWAAQQRALNRITPSIQQQAPATMEQPAEQAPEIEYPSETSPITPEQIQESKQYMLPQGSITPEEILMAQDMAQHEDNILFAPNPFKGELKATGGSLLTSTGPQILNAPQFMKGQLRTLNRGGEVPAVVVGERPQTNPYGDEYIDIDLGSGKPKLKRRSREKWVTGEAL